MAKKNMLGYLIHIRCVLYLFRKSMLQCYVILSIIIIMAITCNVMKIMVKQNITSICTT